MGVGVDLGGVVIDSSGPDTFFTPDYLTVPPVSRAFAAIADINARTPVYVISKCGGLVEAKSRHWLAARHFEEFTGVPPERWFFVRRRSQKADLALELGLSAFVDNRQDVLEFMPEGVQRVLFGSPEVPDWAAVLALLACAR